MNQLPSQPEAALDDILGEMLLDLETAGAVAVLARFTERYPKQRNEIEQLWSDVHLVDEHLASREPTPDPGCSILLSTQYSTRRLEGQTPKQRYWTSRSAIPRAVRGTS